MLLELAAGSNPLWKSNLNLSSLSSLSHTTVEGRNIRPNLLSVSRSGEEDFTSLAARCAASASCRMSRCWIKLYQRFRPGFYSSLGISSWADFIKVDNSSYLWNIHFRLRDGLKGGPVLLSNSQVGPGRNFSQPRARLLARLCTY